jgi:mycothiol synthase
MRAARPDDAGPVSTVINECSIDDVGMAVYTEEDLRASWRDDPRRLKDFEVAEEGRRIRAVLEYAIDRDAPEVYFEGFVARANRSHGLGTSLVERAEQRADALATETRMNVRLVSNVVNDAARSILEARGFRLVGFEHAMWMDLTADVLPHATTAGIELRPYVEGRDDRAMWGVMREGFGNDWEVGRPTELVPWIESHTDIPTHDPSLWFLAYVDGRLAGGIMGRSWWGAQHDVGHVKNLAVVPEERRAGVGRALLHHLAAAFMERGRKAMVLGVEGDNATRARDFYERVGMHARAATYDYEKEVAAR